MSTQRKRSKWGQRMSPLRLWRVSAAESDKLFDVYRPYDRTLYTGVAAGSRTGPKLAVEAATKAFATWSLYSPAERASLFFKAAEL